MPGLPCTNMSLVIASKNYQETDITVFRSFPLCFYFVPLIFFGILCKKRIFLWLRETEHHSNNYKSNSYKSYEKLSHHWYWWVFLIIRNEKWKFKSRENLVLAFWRWLTYQKVPQIKCQSDFHHNQMSKVSEFLKFTIRKWFPFCALLLFSFKYKIEIKIYLKKVSGTRELPKLGTTKLNYCDLHCVRANVFVEWLVINSFSRLYEYFHQNWLAAKIFCSTEQNEHVITFFYKMR